MSELSPYSPSCELQIDEDLIAIKELAEFADESDQPDTIRLEIINKYDVVHEFRLAFGDSITRMVVKSSTDEESYYDMFSFTDPRVNEDGSLRDWGILHIDQNGNHLSKESALAFLANYTETIREALEARVNNPEFIPARRAHG